MTSKINEQLNQHIGKTLSEASHQEIYHGLVSLVNMQAKATPKAMGDKKIYYVSAEFLLGRMLASNLVNLGLFDAVRGLLESHEIDLQDILDCENEPSLGNGGLGRLAACFIDSISTLNLQGDGIGLFYHFGLFKQAFEDYKQREYPDQWLTGNVWFRKTNTRYPVTLGKKTVYAIKYEMDVVGYNGEKNTLNLFDLEGVDESLVKEGISFDQTAIEKNLTLFLYPDDATEEGRLLRIYQQYFMVSSAAQLIIEEVTAAGYRLDTLNKHVVIQINDTHPSMIIPELIYRLIQAGIEEKKAIQLVSDSCAYTNHTILAEALEKWPMASLEQVIPHLIPILQTLNQIALERSNDPKTVIIDKHNLVYMAHLDIHFSRSVNGVAKLHTEILEQTELHHFYTLYPEKFNNKTNGITFRRWISASNPELHQHLKSLLKADINNEYNALEQLLSFKDDETVLDSLLQIKDEKRKQFVKHIKHKQGIDIPEDAMIITQIKRLHEYKRQQMNALYIIHKYLEIKQGIKPVRPLVFVFGAKAAPAYETAKDIIHLLLVMAEQINNDPDIENALKLVFIENYNISEAEIIIPASDVSEQISLASKEASGTGNMKFMLNGAVTIGTNDGANVEIRELVGDENIYMFGQSSDQVIEHYEKGDYIAKAYYHHPLIKAAVDYIVSDDLLSIGDPLVLKRLQQLLINKDWFMTLLDLEDYIAVKDRMIADFENRKAWSKMMLVNIAMSGFFSSDRTISQYNRDIWNIK